MMQDADSPAAQLCPVCGAPVVADERCDYDQPADRSPALGDYTAMNRGLMTHSEHLLVVARWCMHDTQSHRPAVVQRFLPVVQEAWGQAQTLFPLEA